MDITQLSGVSSDYLNTFAKKEALVPGDDDSFSAVLSTAMKSVTCKILWSRKKYGSHLGKPKIHMIC